MEHDANQRKQNTYTKAPHHTPPPIKRTKKKRKKVLDRDI
jgi:hypothetical protein